MSLRLSALLFLAFLAAPASAQNPVEQPVLPVGADSCALGTISYIFIDNASIFDLSETDPDSRFRWAYRTANRLHIRTRDRVIRRELLFGPGSCYDPYLLEETERLLRRYSFLARVDIFAVPQSDSTVHVIVDTRDAWSTRVDVAITTRDGFGIEGLRVAEQNLFGTGQSLGVFYFEREVTREYGIAYHTPQLLGTRWDLNTAVGRTRAGTLVRQEIAYPFVGEVSNWAGRQHFRRDDLYFDYIVSDRRHGRAPRVLMPMRDQAFDLAVLRRIGERGNMGLVGAALTYQELSYPGGPELAPDGNFNDRQPADDSLGVVVAAQREELDNIRAFVLLGHRNVWWMRRRGLDSMRGQEDVQLGGEAILALGRSLPSLETDDDLYASLTLYAGMALDDALVIGRGRADGRRDLTAGAGVPEWEDVYVDADVIAYAPLALRGHTLFLRAAAAGAWNTRTPFQLTLGGSFGLRGYDVERLPGGRRVVFTAEDRIAFAWPLPEVIDMGATLFADVGRVWPGDVPFGGDSGWRGAAGFGLRASFPAGSRSIYRLDIAWPLERGATTRDFRVSLSVGEVRGHSSVDADRQIGRSRTQNVGGNLFTFRN